MKVTSVKVKKIEKENSRMKGIASILLDDMIAIHDIRIISGDNGLFVAMPSRKTATGGYRDIVHPITPEGREIIETAIIDEYNNSLYQLRIETIPKLEEVLKLVPKTEKRYIKSFIKDELNISIDE